MFDDPRRIPYLLIWRTETDGTMAEAARICTKIDPPVPFSSDWHDVFEIKPSDRGRNFIPTTFCPLPRNGGRERLLVCPYCKVSRRALWEPGGEYTTSARSSDWKCRACAKLRYASESGALVHRSRFALAGIIEAIYGHGRNERPSLGSQKFSPRLSR